MSEEKRTILDDIIDCVQRETSSVGTIFVRKQDRIDLGLVSKQAAAPIPKEMISPTRTIRRIEQIQPQVPSPAPVITPTAAPDVSNFTLEQLSEAVRKCTACRLASTRTNTVFSDGDPHAELMFIGEGPGEDEDRQGIPFVGRAGQLLTKMIEAMKFDRSRVYIANIVKCRPPGNRNPSDDESAVCIPYLKRQIELVHPKVIVLLGAVPLKYLMGMTGITRLRGKWLSYNGIDVMPTFHPAYLLRNPASKKEAWADLQMVMAKFGISR